eukprot:7406001-Pyramimonas_sp.AAC.1
MIGEGNATMAENENFGGETDSEGGPPQTPRPDRMPKWAKQFASASGDSEDTAPLVEPLG